MARRQNLRNRYPEERSGRDAHSALFDASSATVRLALGSQVIWSQTVTVPAGRGLAYAMLKSPVSVPAGSPIRWNLIEFSAHRDEPCSKE